MLNWSINLSSLARDPYFKDANDSALPSMKKLNWEIHIILMLPFYFSLRIFRQVGNLIIYFTLVAMRWESDILFKTSKFYEKYLLKHLWPQCYIGIIYICHLAKPKICNSLLLLCHSECTFLPSVSLQGLDGWPIKITINLPYEKIKLFVNVDYSHGAHLLVLIFKHRPYLRLCGNSTDWKLWLLTHFATLTNLLPFCSNLVHIP